MDVKRTRHALDRLARTAAGADEARFREQLHDSTAALRDYLTSFVVDDAPPGLTESYVGDAFQRFLHTLEFIPLPAGPRILELGANPFFFHLLLRRLFPEAQLQGANFFDHDIFSDRIGSATHHVSSRKFGEEWVFTYPLFNLETVPRYPFPDRSFDLIFLCETLEHLVVNPLSVFRKIRRLLAPGGYLVVTLPNAARLINFACLLEGHNPFDMYHPETGVHGRHNREFTLPEMRELLTLHGFEVCRAQTRDRFDYDEIPMAALDLSGREIPIARRPGELYAILESAGGKLEDRGDNLYLLARRPGPPAAAPEGSLAHGLVECAPPPPESPRAQAYVDAVEDEGGRLVVIGWAYLSDEHGSPDEWIKLVFSSAERCYALSCARGARQDVADVHGLERADPGFHAAIDKSGFAPGRYRLGVLLGGPGLEDGFRDLGVETTVE